MMRNSTTPNPAIATVNRRVWHSLVEMGIRRARRRGGPVDVDEVLDSVGLFRWATGHAEARAYALELLANQQPNRSEQ
jgi:hypothetical protein